MVLQMQVAGIGVRGVFEVLHEHAAQQVEAALAGLHAHVAPYSLVTKSLWLAPDPAAIRLAIWAWAP